MTMTFNYKRRKDSTIEERIRRSSLRGDTMVPNVHYSPKYTPSLIVDLVSVRMVISHCVENGCRLEHFDVKSTFLHEIYEYGRPLFVRE